MSAKIALNDPPLEIPVKPKPTLIKTVLWLLVILLLPQLVLGFGFTIFFGIQQGSDFTEEAFSLWFSSVPVLLVLSLITPLLTLPLLNKATQAEGWASRFEFWAVKTINAKTLTKWLVIGFVFWWGSSFIGEWLNLPIEQFMLDVKASGDSVVMLIFIFITICIVVPNMEEIVFRGWLFSKIALTKLGNIGALIITSLAFTAIHSQYEQIITLFMVLALGTLLGFIRYKSNNISYSIIVHMLFNSSATIALFLLPS